MRERKMDEIIRDQKPLMMQPEATVTKACTAMHKRRTGAVLVVAEDNRLAGIFTGRTAPPRELGSDHSARSYESVGITRHSIEPSPDLHDAAEVCFV